MRDDDKPIVIYATFPDRGIAEGIGRALVEARLAACVNLIDGMTSIYNWQGQVETAHETVGIIKTRAALEGPVIAAIRDRHPYDTPAMLTFAVDGGSAPFLAWIAAETDPSAGGDLDT